MAAAVPRRSRASSATGEVRQAHDPSAVVTRPSGEVTRRSGKVTPPSGVVTRWAPTPSGFLHLGNAVNALLVHWMTQQHHGRLLLRIDDFDPTRIREEYVRDVFDVRDWLGIVPDDGPDDAADFAARWGLRRWLPAIQRARDHLQEARPYLVFVCLCSRMMLSDQGFCVRGCREAGIPLAPGESALRLHVPPGTTAPMRTARRAAEGRTELVNVPAGDHVLWRRDDLPAYHLGSVVVDDLLGVTDIVRGVDLFPSSALQVHLAGLLGGGVVGAGLLGGGVVGGGVVGGGVLGGGSRSDDALGGGLLGACPPRSARYHHHELVTDVRGGKLSKSAGTQAAPLIRDDQTRRQVHALAVAIGAPLGISPPAA